MQLGHCRVDSYRHTHTAGSSFYSVHALVLESLPFKAFIWNNSFTNRAFVCMYLDTLRCPVGEVIVVVEVELVVVVTEEEVELTASSCLLPNDPLHTHN